MMRHHRMRLTLVAAALLAAPATHAQTMNSLSNPGSSSNYNYAEPRVRLEDLNKLKMPDTQTGSGLQFYVGPSNAPTWGTGRFNGSGRDNVVGAPPDQSKFNDR